MKKTKLLFILQSYSHGGTNKSLQNMLSLLNKDVYDFYIFSPNKTDIYENIFSQYNLLRCPKLLQVYFTSQCYIIKSIRLIDRNINFVLFKLLVKFLVRKFEKNVKFDKVIAFEEGLYLRLIASSFKANKISWVHCDYKSYHKSFKTDLSTDLKSFLSFDKIICVSQSTAKSFLEIFPKLKTKTDYIYNILNTYEIRNYSNYDELDYKFNNECFTIISIGRLHNIKQFDKIPSIVNKIKNKYPEVRIKWYIIGDGDLSVKKTIINEINKYHYQDVIICMGAKDNPYPYLKKSDLLVVTSLSEAYPCVINEAKILKVPVLTTNFDSAHEIVDENIGIIATIKEFPDIIYKLVNNIDMLYSNLKSKIEKYKFNNGDSINKINQIFNDYDMYTNI